MLRSLSKRSGGRGNFWGEEVVGLSASEAQRCGASAEHFRCMGAQCSGLLTPDTFLGENGRHTEVFDEQETTYFYPRFQA